MLESTFEQMSRSDDEDDEGNDFDEFGEDALETGTVGDASDADDVSTDTSSNDDDEDDEDDDEDDEGDEQALEAALEHDLSIQMQEFSRSPSVVDASNGSTDALLVPVPEPPSSAPPSAPHSAPGSVPPPNRPRSPSPAQNRRKKLKFDTSITLPRSFVVEAICAIPHPVPVHALAASYCMTHLITGSDDGIIRDYDIFKAVNGKVFLTAPQRQHCGVVEGMMKAGQLRYWWEASDTPLGAEATSSPVVMSLAMHSDALWALSGTQQGQIGLHTVRHDPGKLVHLFTKEHRGPISALCIDHAEKGFFSGSWDGDAILWDLNTGSVARRFTAYGAQMVSAAIRPEGVSIAPNATPPSEPMPDIKPEPEVKEIDTKSEGSYDPLFDEEEDTSLFGEPPSAALNLPGTGPPTVQPKAFSAIAAPRNAPPLFDHATPSYSPDVLMTAYIDGQVLLWDRRVQSAGSGVARLWMSEKTPPWCLSACWSTNGSQIYAGRRNGTIDIWDVRCLGRTGPGEVPKLVKTLRNPASSGVVSCVVALPDSRHLVCASVDNIRLWNAAEAGESDGSMKAKSSAQFKIIPGHHGGYISQMLVDPGCRFLVSASSNRGWPYGESTRTVFVHDIKPIQ